MDLMNPEESSEADDISISNESYDLTTNNSISL